MLRVHMQLVITNTLCRTVSAVSCSYKGSLMVGCWRISIKNAARRQKSHHHTQIQIRPIKHAYNSMFYWPHLSSHYKTVSQITKRPQWSLFGSTAGTLGSTAGTLAPHCGHFWPPKVPAVSDCGHFSARLRALWSPLRALWTATAGTFFDCGRFCKQIRRVQRVQ